RARFYNPLIARFTQEDTYCGDGLNLYAYVANNPIRYVDPSGYGCEDKGLNYETNPDHPIRVYRNVDLSKSEAIYVADPRLVVEMPFIGKNGSSMNSEGWLRDHKYFWKELLDRYPEAFSDNNKKIIAGKNPFTTMPTNDEVFRTYFPQYDVKGLRGQGLVHHHVGGGGQAVPVPTPIHPGSGGIHNVEKKLGIWGNDSMYAELLQKFIK
ncbi:RHS repeat-associated core domain-containing protein, partial [Paenibacillus xylanivorans]|uniref:RHS repeat-associated core domain-containing protein n=1 Tax=Paenibacillus xylanivorans TaxID=1705561 RepID=UPI002E807067